MPIPIAVPATSGDENSDSGSHNGDAEDIARDGEEVNDNEDNAATAADKDEPDGKDEETGEQDADEAADAAPDADADGSGPEDLEEAVVEPEDVEGELSNQVIQEEDDDAKKPSSDVDEAQDEKADEDTANADAAGSGAEDNDKEKTQTSQAQEVKATEAEDGKVDDAPEDKKEGEKKASEASEAAPAPAPAAKAKAKAATKPEDDAPLPPPAWADVTYDKLIKYPKSALHARAYFDIQQIRAIKPVTLLAMGIGVPKFPAQLEDDGIIKIATHRGTKFQLYHPSDVIPSRTRAKPFLQKEILRRAILHNLASLQPGEDIAHDELPKKNLMRQKDKLRNGLPTYLPRPGNYTLSQCVDWLKDNPPPKEEHSFLLQGVRQWRKQVRDQIYKINPKGTEIESAIAEFDRAEEEEDDEDESMDENNFMGGGVGVGAGLGEYTSAQAVAAAAAGAAGPTNLNVINNQLQSAFDNYRTQFVPPHVINSHFVNSYSSQLAAAVNMNNIQAQAISQYQTQLAQMQSKIESSTTQKTQFEIYVSKDTFKFNASHFVAYPGFRERLHGHNYKAAVKLLGSDRIGRDGYVLDFGCVKSVVKEICKEMNEYFLVPTLSEVLKITVEEDEDDGNDAHLCGEIDPYLGTVKPTTASGKKRKKRKSKFPGSVMIECEDGSTFIFPRQDCLLLPIMHSTAEELAIYLYGKILKKLDASHLIERGVTAMEVIVSEAVGQDAHFRRPIPNPANGLTGAEFDVASYISRKSIPVMPCNTETESAKRRRM